ncbi:PH domain-containing protein [Streptomyces sp. KL116D]|uniref:PH domain-containing protein n=1 Tax=Streptomyces sp. KL116D TaxID=3045152 RepID=UPI003558863C
MEDGAAGATGTSGIADTSPEPPPGIRAGTSAGTPAGIPAGAPSWASPEAEPAWTGLPPGLLKLRRLLLVLWLVPLAVAVGVLLQILAGPAWAAFALIPLALLLWGWPMLGRNWRSWRYAERADDLLLSRGVLWHEETIVPYGRMQLVEVTSGPLERKFGLASLQLHTAAAATDATIPGLAPAEAERLRDRLTELGEARSAGL